MENKSNFIKTISNIFGYMAITLGLISAAVEFQSEQSDWTGIIFTTTFIILGAYLLVSSKYNYYGGFQTVIGILLIGFGFVMVPGLFSEEEKFINNLATSLSVIIIGISFIIWGNSRDKHIKNT